MKCTVCNNELETYMDLVRFNGKFHHWHPVKQYYCEYCAQTIFDVDSIAEALHSIIVTEEEN